MSQSLNNFFSGSRILIWGPPGSGKSWTCANLALLEVQNNKLPVIFDCEVARWDEMIQANPRFKSLEGKVWNLGKSSLNDDLQVDPIMMLDRFNKIVQNLEDLAITETPSLVVIDGVSDLRRWAMNAELAESGKKKAGPSPLIWGKINRRVEGALFPIINWTLTHGARLLLTCLASEIYEGNTGTGVLQPAAKPFILAAVSEIVRVSYAKGKFFMSRSKSPRGPLPRTNVTGGWSNA